MKDLLFTIVKGIVNLPEEVTVVERESVDFPGLTILEVEVSDEDRFTSKFQSHENLNDRLSDVAKAQVGLKDVLQHVL